MIDGARLLLEQPEVLDHLADRFDCLVIDEFQDTNPLQFSFLWKLHKAGVPALIVGDLKQSIMGFQSADPRLMGSLLEQHPEQCTPLDCNWRSQAHLMDVINAFGEQLFGKDYAPLTPKAPYKSRLHPSGGHPFRRHRHYQHDSRPARGSPRQGHPLRSKRSKSSTAI